jgi:hypothetical protein
MECHPQAACQLVARRTGKGKVPQGFERRFDRRDEARRRIL